jgi:prepilin-type N-terminal cleavage/methylation domain-containing protein
VGGSALDRKGFTLLEVLVGIVVFAVGVLGLTKMQVVNTRGSVLDKNALTAITLAEKRIEELKGTTFAAIASNVAGVTEQGMTTTWTVAPNGTAPSRYDDIAVTVTWTETWQGQTITRSINLTTVISEV